MKPYIIVSDDMMAFWFVTHDCKIYIGDIGAMYLIIGSI